MNEIKHFVPSGVTGDKAKALVYIAIAAVVIFIAVTVVNKVFGGIDGMLEALGLKDDTATKNNKDAIAAYNNDANSPGSPWSPGYWKSAPADSSVQLNQNNEGWILNKLNAAKILYSSVGMVWDDPSEGVAAIKTLSTKAELSLVSDMFNQNFSTDLWAFLQKHYDTSSQVQALNNIITYVNGLPNY